MFCITSIIYHVGGLWLFFCINAWCICWYSASTQALPWLSFPWANKKYQLSLKSYIISDVDWISLLTRQRKMLSSILPLMNVREDLSYNKFKTMWILYWSKWLQKVTNKQIKHWRLNTSKKQKDIRGNTTYN